MKPSSVAGTNRKTNSNDVKSRARHDARADSGSLEPPPASPFETRTSCAPRGCRRGGRRAWAASRNVRFIDGFANFFREPAEAELRKYFIAGDTHLTELGNRLLFDEVRSAVGDY